MGTAAEQRNISPWKKCEYACDLTSWLLSRYARASTHRCYLHLDLFGDKIGTPDFINEILIQSALERANELDTYVSNSRRSPSVREVRETVSHEAWAFAKGTWYVPKSVCPPLDSTRPKLSKRAPRKQYAQRKGAHPIPVASASAFRSSQT